MNARPVVEVQRYYIMTKLGLFFEPTEDLAHLKRRLRSGAYPSGSNIVRGAPKFDRRIVPMDEIARRRAA